MDKIYLEQILDQLVAKANVIIQTQATEETETYCLGNHYAAKWRIVLEKKFANGMFGVSNITQEVKGGTLTWVITLDRAHDKITDRLSSLSNCFILELDL